jgi:serine-type D-Ala-D-Ala carboxypeptidase/endopeptidase (penicillin-binding protein 4)
MYRMSRGILRRVLTVAVVSAVAALGVALPARAVDLDSSTGNGVTAVRLTAVRLTAVRLTASTAERTSTAAATAAVTTDAANARIASLVGSRRHDPVLGGTTSIRVFDTATWKTIYTHRSTEGFRVASNTKLVTASTALATMGASHTFPTTVVLGRPGQVYIVGGGDPLLSSANLRSLAATAAASLKARGISHVTVHLDDTLFAPWAFPSGFDKYCPEDHVSRGYCITPVRALTYDRHSHYDNAKDAASYFTSHLNAASGLAATYGGRGKAPQGEVGVGGPSGATGPTVVARYGGHRLDVIIRAMFFPSDDEIAETLFRQVAVATGYTPTMAGARAAQRHVLTSLNVPLDNVVTSSGSGRSKNDRFTAAAMIYLLHTAVNGSHPQMAVLRDGSSATGGLPLLMRAGIDGTLNTSFGRYSTSPSSCARGLVYAKTGTLSDAIALSGFAKGKDGKWKVFSIFVNNRPTAYGSTTTRQHVDRIAATITGCY